MNLDTDAANLDLVLYNIGINIKRRNDCRALTEPNLVALNLRPRSNSLYEDARSLAAHNYVLRYDDVVLRLGVDHDGPRIEMCERTLMDRRITLQGEDAGGE